MARELPINPPGDPLDWYSKVLGIGSGGGVPFPIIDSVLSTIFPTIDAFGSEKAGSLTSDEVLGGLGNVELAHSAPPTTGQNAPRVRFYVCMEFWHDDVVNRQLRPGRIVPDATAAGQFRFVAIGDSVDIPGDTGSPGGDNRLAVRNFTIGPGQNAAVRADNMGAGAQLYSRAVFCVFQLGQYLRTIS